MSEKIERTQKLYKPTIEGREKAEKLFRESGILFEGDFLDHVMSTYELQQMKNGLGAGYQKQISSIEYHVKSLVDHFTSMLTTEQGDRIQLSEGYEEKLNELALQLSVQQDELTEHKKIEQLMKEEQKGLEKDLVDLQKESGNLTQINNKNEEILVENKERIERLSKMVTDGQEAVLQKQELESKIFEITKLSEKQAEELQASREVIESIRLVHEDQIKMLTDKHADELQRAAERAILAQETALLTIERRLTEEFTNERLELSREIRNLEKRHSNEIRTLYSDMDKLRQQLADAQVLQSSKQPARTKEKQDEGKDKP
ncbi:hypothetical protein [Paenibacillus agricola]|uniref:Uncharacterized protein n=1 Tax=Paenibacillus agricola TaxID=2716264 RepID=A0ABX0JHK2_9BACL|nr:hypothetical protein [Paenibacillus agricola]NHN33195.1 hypothetical protein [Paenibacillus agricola]